LYQQNSVKNLLKPSAYKTVDPVKSMRKTGNSLGKPSDLLIKINNKKDLLPFEIEEMYKKKYRRNKSNQKEINTAERIFTEYVLTDRKEISKLNRTPSKAKYPNSIDNLNELITYRYGPNFRNEVK
jgi:hypothetical protein